MIDARLPWQPGLRPLVFILVLATILRLLWIHTPLIDDHRWRQADTAAMARNLSEHGFDIFYPEVDWGGPHGYVESEFPLMAAIVGVTFKIFGQEDYYGRLVSVAFSTATVAATFALATELATPAAGLAAAYLFAVSPSAVFFGRTLMPDSAMVFFWVFGVFAFVRHFRTGGSAGGSASHANRRWLWLGSASATLACLTKLPAVVMFAPIAAAAWHWRGKAALRDRALLAAVALPLLVTFAWYWHAAGIYRQTGLTFGILLYPAKTYPVSVAPGPWPHAWSKVTALATLTGRDFYLKMLGRMYHVVLMPWGLVGAVAGAAMWKRADGRIVADAWFTAMIVFIVATAEVNLTHEYYQLPLIPVAALYFGIAAAPFFEGNWTLVDGKGMARSVVLVVAAVLAFHFSNVTISHFRRGELDSRMFVAGRMTGNVVPADALVVVVDDHGVTSPLLLYFAHRKGWSLGVENLYPQVIDGLRRQGARYFATTVWPQIERERPDTAYYLRRFSQVPLQGEPEGMAIFELVAER